MPSLPRALFVLALSAIPLHAAAPPTLRSQDSSFFGLTVLHQLHLTIKPDDWATMQPRRGGLGPAGKPGQSLPDGRVVRSQFGFDFEYVPATLTIDGTTLDQVGVRFKGNSSYATTSRILKRPFKIDLDRYIDQDYRGLRKFALNNGIMDASLSREVLAYALYREAGVPAPRTAYALLTLTVPGKYDREVVGLYPQIEVIDKEFLQDQFGSRKGLLLKPERVGPLDYLGPDWARYEERYRPKVTPSKKIQQRFMAFTKLVQDPDVRRFHREIADYLDVDCFLRYLAVTALLSSLDSFMGLPHNYYIHYDPATERFRILPWDLDHAFGGLAMFGSKQELIDLSIRQPWLGRNPLIEKLLRDGPTMTRYLEHVDRLLRLSFTEQRLRVDSAAIARVTADARELERKAVQKRGDGWGNWPMGILLGPGTGTPEAFAAKRIPAVRAQLAGTSPGVVMTNRMGRPTVEMPVAAILATWDKNKDGQLSRDEAQTAIKALVAASGPTPTGEIPQRGLALALEKVWPGIKPGGFFGPPNAAIQMARSIFREIAVDGKLTEAHLTERVNRVFRTEDRLDAPAIEVAMRRLVEARP